MFSHAPLRRVISYLLIEGNAADQSSPRLRLAKHGRPTKDFVSFATFVVKDATSRLSPLLRSCEKWPSTRPSLVSRRTRRYKCRKRPCPQTSLQSSQRKWSR